MKRKDRDPWKWTQRSIAASMILWAVIVIAHPDWYTFGRGTSVSFSSGAGAVPELRPDPAPSSPPPSRSSPPTKPEPLPLPKDKPRFLFTIKNAVVSAWTPQDDPTHPRYSSVRFLRGGDLYDPAKPYPKYETWPRPNHYTIAIPFKWKELFEARARAASSDGFWRQRFVVTAPGYTPPGVYAVPRTRIVGRPRFDVLMTGWNEVHRARQWGVKTLDLNVYEAVP